MYNGEVTLEEYSEMAQKELRVDPVPEKMLQANAEVAFLQGRWFNFYRDEKRQLRRMERALAKRYRDRWHHLKGDNDPSAYQDDPVDFVLDPKRLALGEKKSKARQHIPVTLVEMHLKADDKYNDALDQVEDQKIVVEYLEQVIKSIAFRRNQIQTSFDIVKFEHGLV